MSLFAQRRDRLTTSLGGGTFVPSAAAGTRVSTSFADEGALAATEPISGLGFRFKPSADQAAKLERLLRRAAESVVAALSRLADAGGIRRPIRAQPQRSCPRIAVVRVAGLPRGSYRAEPDLDHLQRDRRTGPRFVQDRTPPFSRQRPNALRQRSGGPGPGEPPNR